MKNSLTLPSFVASSRFAAAAFVTLFAASSAQAFEEEAAGVPTRAFLDINEHLSLPVFREEVRATDFFRAYSPQVARAADVAEQLAYETSLISHTEGAPQGLGDRLTDVFYQIGAGLDAIAYDMADGEVTDPGGFDVLASAYASGASLFEGVNSGFRATSASMLQASGAFNAVSNVLHSENPHDVERFFPFLLQGLESLQKAADDMIDAPVSKAPQNHPCPEGTYRGCTNYLTTTYTNVSCGAWARYVSGPSVGVSVGSGVSAGVSVGICPDGGLWARTCTYDACTTSKCCCECYNSRWDRFWAQNGFRKTCVITDLGCEQESDTELEWECAGAPPATPPSYPEYVRLGDGDDC